MPEKEMNYLPDDTKEEKYDANKSLLGKRDKTVTQHSVFDSAFGPNGQVGPNGREEVSGDHNQIPSGFAQSPFGYEHIRRIPIPFDEPKISFGRRILDFFFGPKKIY